MKALPLLLLLILTKPSFLLAQESVPEAAFLNVVNLIALREPTTIRLGEFALNDGEPLGTGATSGLLAIVPGAHPLVVANPGAKPKEISLDLPLDAGKTVAVICYDEVKEYGDGRSEPKLRCTVLVEGDKAGARLSLVSLLKEPLVGVSLSDRDITLTARQAHQSPVKIGDAIRVAHRGRTLAEFEIAKPIHYLGFLFENPETGEVDFSLIQNEKLEYQPPLESGEETDAED